MKVKDFLNAILDEAKNDIRILNKEITCFDYQNNKSFSTPETPTVVDWNDENFLDIVINFNTEN